jgi:hypothetical protein
MAVFFENLLGVSRANSIFASEMYYHFIAE